MLLSPRQTLSILRNFSLHTPAYTYFTKASDIPTIVNGLESERVYTLSSLRETVDVDRSQIESEVVRLLQSSAEGWLTERLDFLYEFSFGFFVSPECRVFFRLGSKKEEALEEIVHERLWDYQIERAMAVVGLPKECREPLLMAVRGAYSAFVSCDSVLLSIRRGIITLSKMSIVTLATMTIDDGATKRQKEFFRGRDAIAYPMVVRQDEGSLVCIGNGRSLLDGVVDFFQGHQIKTSLALDVGPLVDEKILVHALSLAVDQAPDHPIFIYLFTGLTNAFIVARAVYARLPRIKKIGLYLEGTNVTSVEHALREVKEQCTLFSTLQEAIAWAKKE